MVNWLCFRWGAHLIQTNCCLVAKSCPTLWPQGLQHTRLPCPSPSPGACPSSCPLNWWCHPTSHPLLPCSPPTLNLCQHQGFFQTTCWVISVIPSKSPLITQHIMTKASPNSAISEWNMVNIELRNNSEPAILFKINIQQEFYWSYQCQCHDNPEATSQPYPSPTVDHWMTNYWSGNTTMQIDNQVPPRKVPNFCSLGYGIALFLLLCNVIIILLSICIVVFQLLLFLLKDLFSIHCSSQGHVIICSPGNRSCGKRELLYWPIVGNNPLVVNSWTQMGLTCCLWVTKSMVLGGSLLRCVHMLREHVSHLSCCWSSSFTTRQQWGCEAGGDAHAWYSYWPIPKLHGLQSGSFGLLMSLGSCISHTAVQKWLIYQPSPCNQMSHEHGAVTFKLGGDSAFNRIVV